MPVYKLGKEGSAIREHIRGRADGLARLRASYAGANFPLSVEQVQSVILSDDAVTNMERLEAAGIQDLPKREHVHLRITREAFPEIKRGIAVALVCPREVFIPRSIYRGYSTAFSDPDKNFYLANWDGLDADTRERLTEWVNNVTKATRLVHMVRGTVEKVLAQCETTAHVAAAWPLLATLVTEKDWVPRFRNVPRVLRPYAPSTSLLALSDVMRATEVVLAGAMLLDKYEPDTSKVRLIESHYEQFPNDRKF